jgi:predicted DNA-binding protein (MmcQ/YjbR family)
MTSRLRLGTLMHRAQLIAFCRSLPHATEDVKWGKDLVFSVGGKMFAAFDVEVAGHMAFKTSPETFASLTRKPGIIPAPYAARFHWVAVTDPKALPQDLARELIREAHRLVALKLPLKLRKKLGIETAE